MKLVDEDDENRLCRLRGFAHGLQQLSEICLEVRIIRKTGLRLEVEPDLNVPKLHLQPFGKSGEPAERSFRQSRRFFLSAEPKKRLTQLGRQKRGQRPPFRRLHPNRLHAPAFGVPAHLVEEHRLADTPQSDKKDTFRRVAEAKPLDAHSHLFPYVFTPCEFRRRGPGSGRVRVLHRIHGSCLYIVSPVYNTQINFLIPL